MKVTVRCLAAGVAMFILAGGVNGQAKYDKALKKADALYDAGDYEKGKKALDKFKKKITNKLGRQNKYTVASNLRDARYSLATGMLVGFEANVNITIQNSVAINGENTRNHASTLLDIADLYLLSGHYRLSRETIDAALGIVRSTADITEDFKARVDLLQAEAMTGQGYYNEAIDILRVRESYYAGRNSSKETFVDPSGSLKSRSLSEDEVKIRFNDYARFLTALANAYGQKGSLISADSAFAFAQSWIRKNQGANSLAYCRNQFLFANMLVDNGLRVTEDLPKGTDYEGTIANLRTEHKQSHYLALELYERNIRRLQQQNNRARYLNAQLDLEKLVKGNFQSSSIHVVRAEALEMHPTLTKESSMQLERKSLQLLSNSNSLPQANRTAIEILEFLYALAIQKRDYSGGEKYRSQIVEINKDLVGDNTPKYHLARLKLAGYYLGYTNKIDDASKIYESSFTGLVEREIGAWHTDHLEILNNMAVLFELTDQLKKASSTLDKAGEVARSKYAADDPAYGRELNLISKLNIKLGQYEKAEKDIKSAQSILENHRKEAEWLPDYVNSLETQASLWGIKGEFDQAEATLERSRKLISKSDVPLGDELTTAQELSSLLIMLGRYSQTEVLLARLISEYEKLYGKSSIRLIEPLINKGKLELARGDYTDAERTTQRAYDIANSIFGPTSTKTAAAQKLHGQIDYAIGDYDKAEENIKVALASQQNQFGTDHIESAKSLAELALIKFYNGDNREEVQILMEEARDILATKLGKENPQYADMLKNLAVVAIAEKEYDKAFNYLTNSEKIWRTKTGSKNNINAASIFALTGDVYYQLKNYNKAEENYLKAKDIYEKYFNTSHPEYVRILSKLSKVYYMEKDFKRAKRYVEEALGNYENFIKQFFPALSEREKAKYWNTIKVDFEFYNTLAFSQLEDFRDLSGKVYNYQLLTKALLLSSSIKIRERIANSTDEELKAQYNLWIEKKEMLTAALSMSTAQLTENEIVPAALQSEVEALERTLSQKSELFGQGFESKKITYESVKGALKPNEVAIEMVRYRHFDHVFTDSVIYVALYVTRETNRPRVIELPEGHLMETRYFRYFRNCIIGKIQDKYSYKVFWEPIEKQVGKLSTIYFSADGVYNQLNLEAVPTPDGRYVIDNSNIVMVSNTKDIYVKKMKAAQQPAQNTATMFGNPTFYVTSRQGNINSLPGTEKEITELDKLLKQKGWVTVEYVEKAATEEKVKDLSSPKIFHIATHGFYTPASDKKMSVELSEDQARMAENPLLKTGLLLRGAGDLLNKTKYNYNLESGILTAYEAMSLNLDNTDLVVLSACETGLGEISNGEGVYGLQRAFLVAGAKTLIMSMFKVDDDATQKLILNFYGKWLNTGNLRQSFVEAKKELRTEYPEPIFWGAFMMIGLD